MLCPQIFWTEKQIPQTFSLLECVLKSWHLATHQCWLKYASFSIEKKNAGGGGTSNVQE